MTELDLSTIPRGTGFGAANGARLAIIEAEFDTNLTAGGVRPGAIGVQWGETVPHSLDMRTKFIGEVVYDGPGTPADQDFPDRRSPFYADMERTDQSLKKRVLPNGGVLYVKRQTFGEELSVVSSTVPESNPRPVSECGYYAFRAYASAGEANPNATDFEVAEATAILGGLARILVPSEEDAQWVVGNLLPSGQLPATGAR